MTMQEIVKHLPGFKMANEHQAVRISDTRHEVLTIVTRNEKSVPGPWIELERTKRNHRMGFGKGKTSLHYFSVDEAGLQALIAFI